MPAIIVVGDEVPICKVPLASPFVTADELPEKVTTVTPFGQRPNLVITRVLISVLSDNGLTNPKEKGTIAVEVADEALEGVTTIVDTAVETTVDTAVETEVETDVETEVESSVETMVEREVNVET